MLTADEPDGVPTSHSLRAAEPLARLADLERAQRIAQVGSWKLDLRTNEFEWSAEVFRIFGLDPERVVPSYEAFMQVVHPDDRERVNAAYRNSLIERQPYRITHRLCLPDGRIKYVVGTCETVFDAAGTPLVSSGTAHDITELHKTEEMLALYATVFDQSGEAIVICDADNRIVATNRKFTTFTGYTFDEVRGRNPKVLASGHTSRDTYRDLWAGLTDCGFWQGELSDRRKDGSVYPKWVTISVIRDDQGVLRNYVAHFSDISERKSYEERILRLAHHDALTGLLNRYSLESRLEQAVLTASRAGSGLALLMIDMDHFKRINDSLGHPVGDQILIEVAGRLSECLRESDIVARLGGDEFVAVLTTMVGSGYVSRIASRVLASLREPYDIEGHGLTLSPSIGISVFPDDGRAPQDLMKNADAAMYHAKSSGRNNVQYFSSSLGDAANERLKLEQDLRLAIGSNQLLLHFQPQYCCGDRQLCGFEALVRWQHPERGMISPLSFIGIAEETGLIHPLGRWVMETACHQLGEWRRAGLAEGVRMSINLSANQLHDPSLTDWIAEIIARCGLVPQDVEVEITESVAMADPEHSLVQLESLYVLGTTLAIDDFGTGYSSLAYLKRFPVQVLKLDREFVRDLESDENDASICAATISLAHALGMKVIAEGVENQAQLDWLGAKGCDMVQGFHTGRPESADVCLKRYLG